LNEQQYPSPGAGVGHVIGVSNGLAGMPYSQLHVKPSFASFAELPHVPVVAHAHDVPSCGQSTGAQQWSAPHEQLPSVSETAGVHEHEAPSVVHVGYVGGAEE
jgi:hypothetical protein